jgi:hypothetical protein
LTAFFAVLIYATTQETVSVIACKDDALPPQTASAKQAGVPANSGVPIPPIAKGYEEIYKRFYNGLLIYKKGQKDQIVLPISGLSDPLNGTFDLSRCGDEGKYLSIATGYKKAKNSENASKIEVWIAPKFLIEGNAGALGAQRSTIMSAWTNPACPVGLFWTWGGYAVDGVCDYLARETVDNISANDIYENHLSARASAAAPRVPSGELVSPSGSARSASHAMIFHIFFVN